MKQNRQQSTTISFSLSGIQDILGHQNKLKKSIKDVIKTQKEALKSEQEGTAAYEARVRWIEALEKEYKSFGRQLNSVKDTLERLDKASGKALKGAYASLTKGLNAIDFNVTGKALEEATQKAEAYGSALRGVGARIGGLGEGFHDMTKSVKSSKLSYHDMAAFVKIVEQSGHALAASYKNEEKAYSRMGENATKLKVRMAELDGVRTRLSNSMSKDELEQSRRFFGEMSRYKLATDSQSSTYAKKAEQARDLLAGKHLSTLSSPDRYSVKEVEESVKWLQDYQKEVRLSEQSQSNLNNALALAAKHLKTFNDESRFSAKSDLFGRMSQQMQNIKVVSREALSEQQKYWKDVYEKMENGSDEYKSAAENIRLVNEELARRNKEESLNKGRNLVSQIHSGYQPDSERELEEVRKKLQAYRKELSESETDEINALQEALHLLNKEVQAGKKLMEDAGNHKDSKGKQNSNDYWKTQVENSKEASKTLEENIKTLKAYRDTLDSTKEDEADKLKEVNAAIAENERLQRRANAQQYDSFKGIELRNKSLVELKEAYEALKKEIEQLSPAQEGYNEKAAQMRDIDAQIKNLTKSTERHASALEVAAKKLRNHILIYLSFDKFTEILKTVISSTIELSDLMTNVQKVTNLSNEEIKEMSHLLMGIDTRTANQQLFEMAEQAGKLGLATKSGAQGIVEFVRAGEQIVNTLGDIGGAESITELLKINEVANKDRQGIERDLLRIGSAILNVGNNSKAAYGNVSEFTKRMGSTGSVLNLTLPQIMGLGGAYSALGEEVARSATATQRVMMGIVNHPREVAKSLNISYKALDELLKSGKSYEAFLFVLDALNKEGASAWDDFFKAIGGRNNMQARAAISLLSQHISQLEFQVSLAEEGFKDGTLVTSEFEKANNNLAGVVEQVKNELYEMTTAVEESDGYILDFAKLLLKITKWLKESNTEVNRATFFWGLLAAAIVNLINKGIKIGFFNALIANLKTLNYMLKQTGGAAMLARSAIQKLKAALISNWATLAIAAIAAIVSIIIKLNNAAAEARKELGKLGQAGEEESRELTRLYNKMRDVWNMQGERNKRITEFNKKFGEYYDHLLRETSTLNDLEVAYRAVSSAILEKNAAELEGTAIQKGLEGTKEERAEASGAIYEYLNSAKSTLNRGKGLDTTQVKNLRDEIIHSIHNFYEDKSIANKSEYQLNRYLEEVYKDDERLQRVVGIDKDTDEKIYQNYLFDRNPFKKAIDSYAKAAQKAAEITSGQLEEAEYIRGRANIGKQSLAESLYESILEKKGYEQYQEIEEYLSTVSQITSSEWKESMRDKTEKVKGIVANLVKEEKPWGIQSPDWSEMGGADLAALVDWFNNVQKGFRSGGTFTSAFGHNPPTGVELPASIDSWDKESIIDWAHTNWQKAKEVLKEYNKASGEGNFKDQDQDQDQGKKKEKTTKDIIETTLNNLENYYLERQMLAEKYLNEGLVSEDEYNRYIFANEQEHLRERQNLRKKWLDQTIQFETEGVRRLMQEVDFGAINNYIKSEDADGSMASGYMLDNTKDRNAEERARREIRETLNNALLDKRPLAKVSDNFTGDLFRFGVLGQDLFDATLYAEADAQHKMMERLSFLVQEVISSKSVSAESLKERGKGNPVVSAWLDGLSDENLIFLVNRTNEFYKEYEDAVSKEVGRIKERINFRNKSNGNDDRWASMSSDASRHSALVQMVSDWGMTGRSPRGLTKSDLVQREVLDTAALIAGQKYENIYAESEQARLAAVQKADEAKAEYERARLDPEQQKQNLRLLEDEYLRLEAESLGATTAALTLQAEAWREVEEASIHSISAQQEQIGKGIEQVMPYYENLLSFSEAFGSAIFGKKEDRETASREAIASLIKTTGSMLKEWLVYVTTKRLFDRMEEINEEVKLKKIEAIRLKHQANALRQLGDEALAAETVKAAQNASDAAAAQSKEAAKFGWQGWLIGAGLNLLMTTVFSAISAKVKSQITSATGASGGKLATGMMTYASGRYPVYVDGAASGDMVNVTGADGVRYRARYQPRLQTGVVRTPHLGIVGESGAEVIIDNPTYNNLRRYRPDVLNAIYSMRQMGTRSLDLEGARQRGNAVLMRRAGVPTYADGNVGSMPVSSDVPAIGSDLSAVLSRLDATLSDLKGGIPAYMNMYGTGGGAESLERADKFLRRVGKRR